MNWQTYSKEAGCFGKCDSNYLSLAFCGESGEIAEEFKKAIRDNNGRLLNKAYELGDLLWYVVDYYVRYYHFIDFEIPEVSWQPQEVRVIRLNKLAANAATKMQNGIIVTELELKEIILEIACIAKETGFTLDQIMKLNINKLRERKNGR